MPVRGAHIYIYRHLYIKTHLCMHRTVKSSKYNEFRRRYKLSERLALKYSYDYVSNTVYTQQPYRTVCLRMSIVNAHHISDDRIDALRLHTWSRWKKKKFRSRTLMAARTSPGGNIEAIITLSWMVLKKRGTLPAQQYCQAQGHNACPFTAIKLNSLEIVPAHRVRIPES